MDRSTEDRHTGRVEWDVDAWSETFEVWNQLQAQEIETFKKRYMVQAQRRVTLDA